MQKKRIEYWDKAADELKKIDIPTPEESIDESTMATLIQGKLVAPYEYGLALRLKILDRWHKNSVISEEEYLTNLSDLYKGNQDEINKYLKDKNLQENEQKFRVGLIGEKEYIEKNREIYCSRCQRLRRCFS